MKFLKVKIVLVLVAAVFLIFFFDDYDIIDVEKTAIITAVAIDMENDEGVSPSESVSDGTSGEGNQSGSKAENGGEASGAERNSTGGDSSEKNSAKNKTERYIVTAQIAVPEATDTNSENTRTELSGSGGTIGAAIKAIGDVSGWYPHLSFCNLIILGSSMAETNVIKTLDYFSKTLRLQDSAMVVLAENTAKELLEITTPLDKISSFAIQKVLFKTKGFDADVASTDVKDFCLHYYDVGSSSFMPIVGAESRFPENSGGSGGSESGGSSGESSGGSEEEGGSSGGSGDSSGSGSSGGAGAGGAAGAEEKKVFSAFATALFKEGRKVGELTPEQTLAFNAIRQNVTGTTIELDGVKVGFEKPRNFLLTIIKNKHSFNVRADENGVTASVNLTLYCKISDRNAEASDSSFSKNVPLPPEVIKAAEEKFTSAIKELIETEKQTECDFLRIKRELFRKNYKYFARFKDSYLSHLTENITVTVTGQK